MTGLAPKRRRRPMIKFNKKVVFVGYGAVAQCTLPILLKHVKVPAKNITVIDFEDRSAALKPWTGQGRAVRPRPRHAGEPGVAPGPAPRGRRPPHRPGLEHRVHRHPPVVPRPRRALRQHLRGTLGPVHRRQHQAPDGADAVLAAHAHPQDGRRLEDAGAHGRPRARGQPGPDLALHQAGPHRHRRAVAGREEGHRQGGRGVAATHRATARSTAWP